MWKRIWPWVQCCCFFLQTICHHCGHGGRLAGPSCLHRGSPALCVCLGPPRVLLFHFWFLEKEPHRGVARAIHFQHSVCALVKARQALGGEWPDRAARNITRRQEPSSPEAGLCSALSFCCQVSPSITVTVSQGLSVASPEVLASLPTHPPSLGYQILLWTLLLNWVQVLFPPHGIVDSYIWRGEYGQLLSVPEYSIIVKKLPAQSVTVWKLTCQRP